MKTFESVDEITYICSVNILVKAIEQYKATILGKGMDIYWNNPINQKAIFY